MMSVARRVQREEFFRKSTARRAHVEGGGKGEPNEPFPSRFEIREIFQKGSFERTFFGPNEPFSAILENSRTCL